MPLERGKGAPVAIGRSGAPEMVPVWALMEVERARRVERRVRTLSGVIVMGGCWVVDCGWVKGV